MINNVSSSPTHTESFQALPQVEDISYCKDLEIGRYEDKSESSYYITDMLMYDLICVLQPAML